MGIDDIDCSVQMPSFQNTSVKPSARDLTDINICQLNARSRDADSRCIVGRIFCDPWRCLAKRSNVGELSTHKLAVAHIGVDSRQTCIAVMTNNAVDHGPVGRYFRQVKRV